MEKSAEERLLEVSMAHKAISCEDPIVQALFPCKAGIRLLETFGATRPEDYSFLEPKDFGDLRNSAFAGIPEWDAFADHVQECPRCGEV
jgi:hypothetical protein